MDPAGVRACGFCGEGELRLVEAQALRGGGHEGSWTCGSCGQTIKLLDPGARVVVGLLAVCITAAVPYVVVTDKVARESERPWIVLLVAALAVALVVLFVRDARRQRRHPRRGSTG